MHFFFPVGVYYVVLVFFNSIISSFAFLFLMQCSLSIRLMCLVSDETRERVNELVTDEIE